MGRDQELGVKRKGIAAQALDSSAGNDRNFWFVWSDKHASTSSRSAFSAPFDRVWF